MFVVQANIIGEEVERTVVRVCLRWFAHRRWFVFGDLAGIRGLGEDVMFCDEVAGARVEGACQEGGEYEVGQCFPAECLDDGVVKGELGHYIECVDPSDRELVHHHWPDGVEQDLEGAEEGFAGYRVQEPGFECRGKIGIQTIDTERFVMGEVVWAK